jgi:hypothetical protein
MCTVVLLAMINQHEKNYQPYINCEHLQSEPQKQLDLHINLIVSMFFLLSDLLSPT